MYVQEVWRKKVTPGVFCRRFSERLGISTRNSAHLFTVSIYDVRVYVK